MKTRPVFPLLTSSLLLLSGGCGFFPFPGGNDTAQSPEPPTPQQAPDAPPPVPVPESTPIPDVDMGALGLIPPVTPKQRLSEIDKGRANPFALIPITAKVPGSGTNGDGNGPTEDGKSPTGGDNSTKSATLVSASGIGGESTQVPEDDARTCGVSNLNPNASSGDFASFPPFPREAAAVTVSGIGVIGQKPFAIIQAPGETVSRNVGIGERIAGGKVLVASIGNSVVLTQDGETITRKIGEPPQKAPPPPIKIAEGGGIADGIRVLGLKLEAFDVSNPRAVIGEVVICNVGDKTIKGIQTLTFQVEGKGDGTVESNSGFDVYITKTYLQKGQKAKVNLEDISNNEVRNLDFNNVVVKLVEWSTNPKPEQRKEEEIKSP